MELDTNKIDEAVLALLYLGLHDGARVWKSFDREAMNRLHEKGFITDPRGKAMSVLFTAEGRARAEELLVTLFGKPPEPGTAPVPGRIIGFPPLFGSLDWLSVQTNALQDAGYGIATS